jgi:hypothetical protein
MRHTIIAIAAAALAFMPSAQAAIGTVEADNGTVYQIGAVHVPYDRSYPITAEIYSDDGLVFITLDCNGSFSLQTQSGSGTGWRHIPSRSVTAKIAQISCAKAQARRTSPKS